MAATRRRWQNAVLQPADRGAGRRLGREERGRRLQVLALRRKGDNVILWIHSIGLLYTQVVRVHILPVQREKPSRPAFRGQRSRGFNYVGQVPLAAK